MANEYFVSQVEMLNNGLPIECTDFSLSHALDKYLNILLNLRCTLIYRVFIIKITAIISVSKKNNNSLYLKNPF